MIILDTNVLSALMLHEPDAAELDVPEFDAVERAARVERRVGLGPADAAAVEALMDTIWREAPLDVLVNNAAATLPCADRASVSAPRRRHACADVARRLVLYARCRQALDRRAPQRRGAQRRDGGAGWWGASARFRRRGLAAMERRAVGTAARGAVEKLTDKHTDNPARQKAGRIRHAAVTAVPTRQFQINAGMMWRWDGGAIFGSQS